ncbi:MAG: transposase [Saprospiraceae bacterium]|nr:transposase [Saprospiraceae bacterium]
MRKSTISKSQRLAILAKWEAEPHVDELCRTYQISVATLYNWRKAKAEDEDESKRRLKELEAENARLKKMYAELSIDHGTLKKRQTQGARKK